MKTLSGRLFKGKPTVRWFVAISRTIRTHVFPFAATMLLLIVITGCDPVPARDSIGTSEGGAASDPDGTLGAVLLIAILTIMLVSALLKAMSSLLESVANAAAGIAGAASKLGVAAIVVSGLVILALTMGSGS